MAYGVLHGRLHPKPQTLNLWLMGYYMEHSTLSPKTLNLWLMGYYMEDSTLSPNPTLYGFWGNAWNTPP